MRKLIYFVAISADGFIADTQGGVDDFPLVPETLAQIFAEYPETCPAHLRGPLGIDSPPRHFDTVVMESKTHQPAIDEGLTSAYPHLRASVGTSREFPHDDAVTFFEGDPADLVRSLKAESSRLDIWLCGGAHLAGQLVDEIDEYHLKINPVALGEGIPLMRTEHAHALEWVSTTPLAGGVMLTVYRPRRDH